MSANQFGTRLPRALDFAEFAQEFLRRNPLYRAQFRAVMSIAPGPAGDLAKEEMARSWGLAFPVPARARRRQRARAVAGIGGTDDRRVPPSARRLGRT